MPVCPGLSMSSFLWPLLMGTDLPKAGRPPFQAVASASCLFLPEFSVLWFLPPTVPLDSGIWQSVKSQRGQLILSLLVTAKLFLPSLLCPALPPRLRPLFLASRVSLKCEQHWSSLALTALARQVRPPSALQPSEPAWFPHSYFSHCFSGTVWCSKTSGKSVPSSPPRFLHVRAALRKKRHFSSSNMETSCSNSHSEAICYSNSERAAFPVHRATDELVLVLSNINLWARRKRFLSA